MAKLSIELERYFFEEERQPKVKLGDILALAGERTFGFLFAILALPSALPVPAPGYSTPFGLVILLLVIQFIVGAKRPWLPQRLMNSSIKLETAQKIVKGGIPFLKRLEALTKPRMTYICTTLPGRLFVGIPMALMSISMMIPIPGTNTIPAMGIFITALGLVEDDGIICAAGGTFCYMVAVLMISVIIAFYRGGTSLLDLLKNWIKGLF